MTTAHLEQKTHLVGRMGPYVVFLDIGTNDLSSGYPIERLVERVLAAARILISFYHVKQVVILEIFRRLPTGRYHCPVDFNDRVVSYNTLLKERIDAAGPRTHPQFNSTITRVMWKNGNNIFWQMACI